MTILLPLYRRPVKPHKSVSFLHLWHLIIAAATSPFIHFQTVCDLLAVLLLLRCVALPSSALPWY